MRVVAFLAPLVVAGLACAGGAPPPDTTPHPQPSASVSPPPPPVALLDAGNDAPLEAASPHASEPPFTIIAHHQQASTAFATDGYDVIWVDESDGTINRVPRGGGVVETLYEAHAPLLAPAHIAADGTFIFWTMQIDAHGGQGSMVMKRDIVNGRPEEVIDKSQEDLRGLAIDDHDVYWIAGASIHRQAKSGGAKVTVASRQASPSSVALDRGFVFWTNAGSGDVHGSVMKKARSAGAAVQPTVVVAEQEGAQNVWLDAENVYWVSGAKILRAAKGGGSPSTVAELEGSVVDLALDDRFVYYAGFAAGGEGVIARVAKEGGTVERIASHQPSPVAVALNAGNVYWTCKGTAEKQFSDGYVAMAAKP